MRNSLCLTSPRDTARALVLPLLFSRAFCTFSNKEDNDEDEEDNNKDKEDDNKDEEDDDEDKEDNDEDEDDKDKDDKGKDEDGRGRSCCWRVQNRTLQDSGENRTVRYKVLCIVGNRQIVWGVS